MRKPQENINNHRNMEVYLLVVVYIIMKNPAFSMGKSSISMTIPIARLNYMENPAGCFCYFHDKDFHVLTSFFEF